MIDELHRAKKIATKKFINDIGKTLTKKNCSHNTTTVV